MKATIIAKRNLDIEQNGKIVSIVKGDKFNLYGKIFAYKGVIIDITKYSHVFDVIVDRTLPQAQCYKVTKGIAVQSSVGMVTIPAGTTFKSIKDIVCINGAVIDIAKYAHAIEAFVDVEDVKAEMQPAVAPEPTVEPEPAVVPEPTVEPEPAVAPEPTVEPEPAVAPEPTVEPEPAVAPEPTVEPDANDNEEIIDGTIEVQLP